MRSDRRFTFAAVAVAVGYVLVLWFTAGSVGFTRDEGYYFKAAEEYAGWFSVLFSGELFSAFTDPVILKYFDYNHEHPPLVKLSQGATFHLFHGLLGIASPSQGFRASGFLWGGLSVFATFLLGRELVSARVGLLAALLMTSIPRYFFDAHLACFDVAITAMWTLSLWAFVRAYRAPPDRVRRASVFAGLVWGLGLATKLNALFLPFVFVLLWLLAPAERVRLSAVRSPGGGWDVRLPRLPLVLVTCAVLGPLVFVATWPYLWHDTFVRIGAYIGFHLNHEHYPALYFHQLLVKPPFPWSFPLVMSAITVPMPIWVLGALGFVVSLYRALTRRRLADATLVLATGLPIFLIAMPTTPIFGGVKHWYNAMPTLCLLAARSVFWALERGLPRMQVSLRAAALAAAAALCLAPGYLGTAHTHPNGIGYYNALAGGVRGGAELGMQRGFWGGLAFPMYGELGALTGGRGRVFFNRTNWDSYRMYRREGLFPNTVHYANKPKGAQAGVHFEQAEHGEAEGEIWSVMGTRPIRGVYQDNVTLNQLYLVGPSSEAPR